MERLTFQILDKKHREWFIARLLPHIHGSLIQKNFTVHSEALEIDMKLEASMVRDNNRMV